MKEETIKKKVYNLKARREQIVTKVSKLEAELGEIDKNIKKWTMKIDYSSKPRRKQSSHSRIDSLLDTIRQQLKQVK